MSPDSAVGPLLIFLKFSDTPPPYYMAGLSIYGRCGPFKIIWELKGENLTLVINYSVSLKPGDFLGCHDGIALQ